MATQDALQGLYSVGPDAYAACSLHDPRVQTFSMSVGRHDFHLNADRLGVIGGEEDYADAVQLARVLVEAPNMLELLQRLTAWSGNLADAGELAGMLREAADIVARTQ